MASDGTASHIAITEGDRMSEHTRKKELERRLEQSRRLLHSVSDDVTRDRIARLIGDLEREQQLLTEK
jgi:hypothetical protein